MVFFFFNLKDSNVDIPLMDIWLMQYMKVKCSYMSVI